LIYKTECIHAATPFFPPDARALMLRERARRAMRVSASAAAMASAAAHARAARSSAQREDGADV